MNEKPCCSLQITQASSVSQIRMEVTAGQRGGMMDSPHSKSSMPTGSFLSHNIGREGWAFPEDKPTEGVLGAGLFVRLYFRKKKKNPQNRDITTYRLNFVLAGT